MFSIRCHDSEPVPIDVLNILYCGFNRCTHIWEHLVSLDFNQLFNLCYKIIKVLLHRKPDNI